LPISIAILRLSSLGDIVLTAPLIEAIREKYHDARIDFITKEQYGDLAERLPEVSNVIRINTTGGFDALREFKKSLKATKYDFTLDLHNNFRTVYLRTGLSPYCSVVKKRSYKRLLLVQRKKNLLRREPDVTGRYFETVRDLGIQDSGKPPRLVRKLHSASTKDHFRIGLCPGSKHWNKQWPIEYWKELALKLFNAGARIELFGAAEDQVIASEILSVLPHTEDPERIRDFTGKLPITKTIDYIARCRVAITNDSGLMHIASAVGVPVISFFGPTVTTFGFAPRAKNATLLEVGGLYCRPCTTIGRADCPEKHFKCMMELTPELVLDQFYKVYRDYYLFQA
jgi:heptosyltransferase-2